MKTYISTKLRLQIEQDAGHRCGYCLSDETLTGIPLSVEHIIPEALGGETRRENLWLACRPCNEYKGTKIHAKDPKKGKKVPLFDLVIITGTNIFIGAKMDVILLGKLSQDERLL